MHIDPPPIGALAGMKSRQLGAGLLLIAATLSPPVAAQKSPDVRVNRDIPGAASSRIPQIAASGDSVYVTWSDQRNAGLDTYFNRSLDGGATWLRSDIQLDTSLGSSFNQQIVASGDSVYVTWRDQRNGSFDIYFNRSLDAGETWLGSSIRLDTDTPRSAKSDHPQITALGDSVYVAWEDGRNGLDDIYFNRSLDGGATWSSSDIRLDTDPPGTARSRPPQIAAAGDSVYVTWLDERNGSEVFLNRSSDQGATWLSSDLRVDTEKRFSGHVGANLPRIAASGDSVYVAWVNRYAGSDAGWQILESNRSIDGGISWLQSDTELIKTSPFFSSPRWARLGDPQITASGSTVYVTGTSDGGLFGNDSIYFRQSLDSGVTWISGGGTSTDSAVVSVTPQVETSGTSVYLAWQDGRDLRNSIYFNRSLDHGATWLASDIRMDRDFEATAHSINPQIAVSSDSIYVVWSDTRNDLFDVYLNNPFGALPYGSGTEGSGTLVPQLHGTDSLTLGRTFTLTVTGGLGGALGLLGSGGPGSKTSIPFAGGSLLIHPIDHVLPVLLNGTSGVAGDGTLAIDILIPLDTAFLGFNVNFQAAFLDPGAIEGLALTNGVEAWVL